MTSVVNLRFTSEWDVFIGRATSTPITFAPYDGADGIFGNPLKVYRPCVECGITHFDVVDLLDCYRAYVIRRAGADLVFADRLRAIQGKRLACFCKPRACHGDILAELLNAGFPDKPAPSR